MRLEYLALPTHDEKRRAADKLAPSLFGRVDPRARFALSTEVDFA